MGTASPVQYARTGAIAVLTIDNPPVNALSQSVRLGLLEGLTRAEAELGVEALLLVGAGYNFIAGADIREFGKPPLNPLLPDLCRRLESTPLLTVAALHGVSLGGGLEIALCADYRIAVQGARMGLPEVRLGLIPGAGGTQRLPRLTGVEVAVDLVTSGRKISAAAAHDLGILDEVRSGVPETVELAYAQELLSGARPRRPLCDLPAPAAVDWARVEELVVRKARGQIAPIYALRALQASTELPFDEGIAEERRLFLELMQSDQRKALIHLFFAERKAASLPELEGVAPRAVEAIGVVGGGTMGAGIATSALLAGLPVTLVETSEAATASTRDRIAEALEVATRRGKLTSAGYEKALGEALQIATDHTALAQADVVIEAVFEDMAVKKAVFKALASACKPDAVLATNTSYLDIHEIAAASGRPEDVIGLHFFSPAHVMRLLEVVVPDTASSDAVATGFQLAKRMGKTAVRAGVCDGFIGNRLLTTCRMAADQMVLDGASPLEVDAALRSFGFAMGPYAVADLAGLDIGWANRKRLASTRDPALRIASFPDRLCEAGFFGQKSGAGYYDYSSGREALEPNPKALELIEAERAERGIDVRAMTPDDIVSRFLAAMVNEAAKIVGEGIARRPLDIDVVQTAGYGFPRHRGGPCKWADLKGLGAVLSEIETFAREDRHFWQPAPLLVRLAKEGTGFDSLNES